MRLPGPMLAILIIAALPGFAQTPPISDANAPDPTTLPLCVQGDPKLLLPDLVPDTPASPRNISEGGRRVIQFTTAVGNVGDGPLILAGKTISTPDGDKTQGWQLIWKSDGSMCSRVAGIFEFHPEHHHFHFDDFVGYELRTDNPDTGALASTGAKVSFCLIDIQPIQGFHPDRFPREVTNMTCDTQEGVQGISVGWKDVYDRFLPGQSILLDLDNGVQVPVGGYFLVNRVDPDHQLWEKRTDNNVSFASVSVVLPPRFVNLGPAPTQRPAHPHLNPGRPRPTHARPVGPVRNRVTATPTPTPTPTPAPPSAGHQSSACDNACVYSISQFRMSWYTGTGLTLSSFLGPLNCPRLRPTSGQAGTVQLINFVTQDGRNTGLEHDSTFVLGDGGSGDTSLGGTVQFSPVGTGFMFTYSAPVPPLASVADHLDFPVGAELCVTLGTTPVKIRMACQPKGRGMLCHES